MDAPAEIESGGLHLRGASSIGKSTALAVAGSAWGGGESGGYVGDLTGLARCDLRKLVEAKESIAMPEGDAFKTVRGAKPQNPASHPPRYFESNIYCRVQ